MKRLERLEEIANRQLGGLEANQEMFAKIRLKAAEEKTASRVHWKPVLACALAFVMLFGCLTLIPQGKQQQELISSHSAGVQTTEVPAVGDLPAGSINMSGGSNGNSGSLFASASGNTFPLVIVNGATYRMLTSPNGISSGLMGQKLGTVDEFNVEPALGTSSIISNTVGQGEAVYAIDGMSGALIAAPVNGTTRVFQRISYAGTATIGGENLADTLCSADEVSWIFVEGIGTVSGADAEMLMNTLLSNADYQSTGMSGSGSMQIGLKNGLVLQLMVGNDCVSACGTWSCPDFFEALHEAVGY
ncbi:MAG: hypothetical protein E7331_01445 [Clostridiales bacterium]|nr:hypothetical protein [Clostridiales bacterium]